MSVARFESLSTRRKIERLRVQAIGMRANAGEMERAGRIVAAERARALAGRQEARADALAREIVDEREDASLELEG